MKLSVIVPVYKAEAYLNTCVDSLLAQTLTDMEIILVNDGSPDRSGEILADYAAAWPGRIKTLTLTNGGQGRARNRGMALAEGEYLGFVDSDDWVEPTMYETMCRAADEQDADVVDCCIRADYADGRWEILPTWRDGQPMAAAGSCCNKLFRRSAVGEIRYPEGLWYEDFYFSAVMLVRSAKTAYVPEPLYIYRRGQESTMHNNNAAKNLDMLRIMEMLEKELIPLGRRSDFEFFLINHVILDSISRLARQETPEKAAVIRTLRRYAQQKLPHLTRCESFRAETRNRRIIMFLNYHGMEKTAQLILRAKSRI